MRLKLTLLFLITSNFLFADKVSDYLDKFKSSGKSDYKMEKYIIEEFPFSKLIEKLTPYYADSIVRVRQKAYQFTYKKGLLSDPKTQEQMVLKLLSGCNDKNGGIVGQQLSYLSEFSPEVFNDKAKKQIDNLLAKKQITHFKDLAMLAGQVGASKERMHKAVLMPDIKNETKWALSLALARQGSVQHTEYCVDLVQKNSINSDLISYVIPDLIYTRQKLAIDYCIEIIHSNQKDCYSPNPDKPEFILCAYRVMELLAPVIIDFPFEIDATGSLVSNDYEEALKITRDWFINNPTFEVRQ